MEEEPEDDEIGCEFCGSLIGVVWEEDPYDADINDDHTKHWICTNCKQEHADDI